MDSLEYNIPIYIPSYNRAETIKTTVYLDASNVPYKLLLNSQACKEAYIKGGRVNPDSIIVTGVKGISANRQWVVDNLGIKGEWYISLDDNISGFKRFVDEIYYSDKSEVDVDDPSISHGHFRHSIPANEMYDIFVKETQHCDEISSEYLGFATVDNYYFNSKRYRHVGYVIAKAVAIKHDGLCYDQNLEAMEEYGYNVDQLIKNEKVLIHNWAMPIAGHYEPGGIGSYAERTPRKVQDCKYLMEKYPGFLRYKVKKDCHPQGELQICFNTIKQLKEWKQKYLNPNLTLF